MFELVHKVHVILNELKGFEAGYTSKDLSVLYVRYEEKEVFAVHLKEIGATKNFDLMDALEFLPKVQNRETFKLVTKLSNALELFKDFSTGYTTSNQETLLFEFKDVLHQAKVEKLGEGKIQDFIN